MLVTKLVVRILDADDHVLAWTEVQGLARGDGCLWPQGKESAVVERAGDPVCQSIHWADVNVEVRVPFASSGVRMGDVIHLFWPDSIFRVGPAAGALPEIIVRSPVTVQVLPGAMGIRPN